jgi:hypothetical protein
VISTETGIPDWAFTSEVSAEQPEKMKTTRPMRISKRTNRTPPNPHDVIQLCATAQASRTTALSLHKRDLCQFWLGEVSKNGISNHQFAIIENQSAFARRLAESGQLIRPSGTTPPPSNNR